MASNLLKLHWQTWKPSNLSTPFPQQGTLSPLRLSLVNRHRHCNFRVSFFPSRRSHYLSIRSSPSSSTPPASKNEAIQQAKTCLSKTLEKPLNNLKLVGKLKKLKQPRFQVEIPVIDDSPTSLSRLAYDVFKDLPVQRKSSRVKILILWPSLASKNTAIKAFQSSSLNNIEHVDISSVRNDDTRILSSADVAVFMVPESSQLPDVKTVSDSLYPKPVVLFNPGWGYGLARDFGDLSGFVGSFEVIYSFVGLEVKGVLRNRIGVVFRCARDGVVSGETWSVLMEEEGELKVVSRFKARPSIDEVENVLYNWMAINSPITKSAKFLRDLVSNVTGRKEN